VSPGFGGGMRCDTVGDARRDYRRKSTALLLKFLESEMQLQSPRMQGMIEGGRLNAYPSIIGLPLAFWASRKPRRTRPEELRFHQFMHDPGRRALIGILGNAHERDNSPQGEFVH